MKYHKGSSLGRSIGGLAVAFCLVMPFYAQANTCTGSLVPGRVVAMGGFASYNVKGIELNLAALAIGAYFQDPAALGAIALLSDPGQAKVEELKNAYDPTDPSNKTALLAGQSTGPHVVTPRVQQGRFASWPELLKTPQQQQPIGQGVVNIGISGGTAAESLDAYKDVIYSECVDWVINDATYADPVWLDPSSTSYEGDLKAAANKIRKNIRAMMLDARDHGLKAVLIVPPSFEKVDLDRAAATFGFATHIDEAGWQVILDSIEKEIDFGQQHGLLSATLSWDTCYSGSIDGLHPDVAGQFCMASVIEQVLSTR